MKHTDRTVVNLIPMTEKCAGAVALSCVWWRADGAHTSPVRRPAVSHTESTIFHLALLAWLHLTHSASSYVSKWKRSQLKTSLTHTAVKSTNVVEPVNKPRRSQPSNNLFQRSIGNFKKQAIPAQACFSSQLTKIYFCWIYSHKTFSRKDTNIPHGSIQAASALLKQSPWSFLLTLPLVPVGEQLLCTDWIPFYWNNQNMCLVQGSRLDVVQTLEPSMGYRVLSALTLHIHSAEPCNIYPIYMLYVFFTY